MAQSASAKKQIIESIGEATNILVAVNKNPSVDELSAALGLTIFLNKLGKHATAVFSGAVPPAIEFLKPDKTFETTTDSLRDFIIALDKEKADHLRYKVVDDAVVKIFITPYKTTITEADLEFSHGDYNVDLVIALNVANNDDLDEALAAHGKILHDAKVVTVTSGENKSGLGAVDWHEGSASGVSEMSAEVVSELKTAKAVLDEQISTALLTGIVAATERFSNNLTSSRVMTIAAELMASGANQQLIATKLTESKDAPESPDPVKGGDDTAQPEASGDSLKIDRSEGNDAQQEPSDSSNPDEDTTGVMQINHMPQGDLDEVAKSTARSLQDDAARVAEKLAEQAEVEQKAVELKPTTGGLVDVTDDLRQVTEAMTTETKSSSGSDQPLIGGTLNATTEQAAEDKRHEIEADRNRVILTHSTPAASAPEPVINPSPLNSTMSGNKDEPDVVDIFASPSLPTSPATEQSPAPSPVPSVVPTLADIEAEATKKAAEEMAASSFTPLSPGLPPMPDFSSLPPLPPAPVGVDPSGLPPLPAVEAPPAEFNPSQFQIPGQK